MTLSPEWFCVGFSQVVSRRLFTELPTRPRPSVPGHPHGDSHDVWSCLVANATGTIVRIGAPLVLYRRHGANATDLGERLGPRERWRTRLRAEPGHYAGRGRYLTHLADLLASYAGEARDPEFSKRLEDASTIVRRLAGVWNARATLHTDPSLKRRLSALRMLATSGAYKGGGIWTLGPANLVKDAAGAPALGSADLFA